MAAQILGRGIDDDGRTMIQRPAEQRGGGVVHDQRDSELTANGGDLGDREDLELRVRQGLGVVGPRAVVGCAAEGFRVGWVDEANLDPLILQRVGKEIPGAAIEGGRADDVVARPRQVLHRIGRRRLTRGDRQCADAPLKGGDALFQHIGRGVHDSGVDVAQLGQREERGGMAGVAELVGRGLMDRHRHRAGGGIGPPAGVNDEGFRVKRDVGHGGSSLDLAVIATVWDRFSATCFL